MKTIKYLVMSVLLAGFSTTAMAQEAELNAALQAIKNNSADKAELVKTAQKKNKKNADALVAIGQAFLQQNDTAQARVFGNLADVAAKHKSAPAFILLGDVEAYANDGGKAASYYNQATVADPKDPTGYRKYALVYRKISPKGAVQKLEDLKLQRPDVEVDEIIGRIYSLSLKYDDAIAAWKKVPVSKMERSTIVDYALANFFLGKQEDALNVAKQGLAIYPRAAALNRLAMMTSVELGDFDGAKRYSDALFNRSDSAKLAPSDYYYTGLAFAGTKDYEKAIDQYQKAIADTASNSLVKKVDVLKKLSDTYGEMENYPKAVETYKIFLAEKEKPTMNEFAALGTLYSKYADKLTDAVEKEAALKQADAVYQEMGEKYQDAIEYATYMRANINSKLDPDSKKGLAKPYYEQLVSLLASKADRSKADNNLLTTAYHYLMAYNFLVKNDKATAKEFANKILQISPDYAPAIQIRDLK
jgi:tetratricopeptide (TPR) repeat protein